MRLIVCAIALIVLGGCASAEFDGPAVSAGDEPVTSLYDGGRAEIEARKQAQRSAAGNRPRVSSSGLPSAVNPDEAFQWQRLRCLDENGKIAPDALAVAMQQRQAMLDFQAAGGLRGAPVIPADWTNRGPSNIGGRTRSLLVLPSNTNVLISGSVGGGIFKSTDGGATWRAVNDTLPNLAICCLALDPSNENVMYAGTGEGFFNSDAIGGGGIYKSTDAGETWTLLPSTSGFDNVCRIAVHPTNPSIILISKRYGGVLRSTDGGMSWSTRYSAQGSFFVAFDPTDPTKVIASVIDHDGAWFHRAMWSGDTGLTWNISTGGLSRVDGFSSRIELAYAPSNTSIVYANCAAGGVVWRSSDGGHSYVLQTTTGSCGSSWYACPIWVDPTNPATLVVGGTHTWRSTNSGATMTQISNGYINTTAAHPDIHFFLSNPGFNGTTNRRWYVCTDGGVHRTENIYTVSNSSGWVNLQPTYRATQFYSAVGHGGTGKVVGGTQDNGTLTLNTSSSSALLTFGGDGGFCAIDPGDPNYLYGEYIYLQIHRSTNGGTSASYIDANLPDAGSGSTANFIAPFILDPNNSNAMLAGGLSLWRSANVKASPTSSVAWTAIRGAGSAKVAAIAVAPPPAGSSDIVWVAQTNGEIYRTANATAATPTWTTVDNNTSPNPLPNRYCSRILIDPGNPNTVYACFGGFSGDNLHKTINNGANWTDITGSGATGLPNAPIYGIARHPSLPDCLFVATQVGIFGTTDGGATWSTSNRLPANVRTDEINFLTGSTTLVAGTHGRGIYTAPAIVCPADFDNNGQVNPVDVAAFVNAWSASLAAGNLVGDFDHNGSVTPADVAAFVSAWSAELSGGC